MTRPTRVFAALGLLLLAGTAARAGTAPPLLHPSEFQSFVANWTPEGSPLCAALQSREAWDQVMKPAAVMGANRPFAPPAELWTGSAVLLLAEVVPSGDADAALQFKALHRHGATLDLDLALQPLPPASSRMKAWLGITLAKPLPSRIRFRIAGKPVCTLQPQAGLWLQPHSGGK